MHASQFWRWLCHAQVARLRAHLEQIKHDDRMIKAEGLDSLSEEELRQVSILCLVLPPRGPLCQYAAAITTAVCGREA